MHHIVPKYNYYLKVWTLRGVIEDCHHGLDCECRSRRWAGLTLQQVETQLQLHLIEA